RDLAAVLAAGHSHVAYRLADLGLGVIVGGGGVSHNGRRQGVPTEVDQSVVTATAARGFDHGADEVSSEPSSCVARVARSAAAAVAGGDGVSVQVGFVGVAGADDGECRVRGGWGGQ